MVTLPPQPTKIKIPKKNPVIRRIESELSTPPEKAIVARF